MTRCSRPYYRPWVAAALVLLATFPYAPAFAAPRRGKATPTQRKAPPAKPPAIKPPPAVPVPAAPGVAIVSRGETAILVDHLKLESPTIVLFYRPGVADEEKFADYLRERTQVDPRVGLRFVALPSLDQPIAKQYEVSSTPFAFVYDRNKNLLGKGSNFEELAPLVGKALRVARLNWINEDDPTAAEVYRTFGGGKRGVPEIMKTMSFHPGLMEAISQIAGRYHFSDGFLTRRDHEIIASYVSALNKCKY